jgi:hypothetical protein
MGGKIGARVASLSTRRYVNCEFYMSARRQSCWRQTRAAMKGRGDVDWRVKKMKLNGLVTTEYNGREGNEGQGESG